LPRS
jgi:ABC-type transporter Mla MlaB component